MMKFDFTPVVKTQGNVIAKRMFVMGIISTVFCFLVSNKVFAFAFFQGIVLGIMDMLIMFKGIRAALPYVKEPKKGLAIMRRYRWYRLLACSSVIVLLLKQHADVVGAMLALLFSHIILLIQLIFIAYNLNKKDT